MHPIFTSLNEKFPKQFRSNRSKGTAAFLVVSLAILFSYQNCIKQTKETATQVQSLLQPPTNVMVDIAT